MVFIVGIRLVLDFSFRLVHFACLFFFFQVLRHISTLTRQQETRDWNYRYFFFFATSFRFKRKERKNNIFFPISFAIFISNSTLFSMCLDIFFYRSSYCIFFVYFCLLSKKRERRWRKLTSFSTHKRLKSVKENQKVFEERKSFFFFFWLLSFCDWGIPSFLTDWRTWFSLLWNVKSFGKRKLSTLIYSTHFSFAFLHLSYPLITSIKSRQISVERRERKKNILRGWKTKIFSLIRYHFLNFHSHSFLKTSDATSHQISVWLHKYD